MTLFMRVFNNRTKGKTAVPEASHQVERPELELSFDDEIVTGIAAVVGEQAAGTPTNYDAQVAMSEISRGPTTEIAVQAEDEPNLQDPPPLELKPIPTVDPGMAERAALAQREIEKSQKHQETNSRPASFPRDEAHATLAPQQSANQNDETVAPNVPVRPGRAARRVRTRMLGFGQGIDAAADPFEQQKNQAPPSAQKFPVGWMVVVAGPGKGHSFAVFNGVSTIGRGVDQTVALDFGDSSVSRERHAAVAYDDENNKFFLGHGGKSNIVRLNDRPVLITEDLSDGDTVRIGETTLRFVALCGTDFAWGKSHNDET